MLLCQPRLVFRSNGRCIGLPVAVEGIIDITETLATLIDGNLEKTVLKGTSLTNIREVDDL